MRQLHLSRLSKTDLDHLPNLKHVESVSLRNVSDMSPDHLLATLRLLTTARTIHLGHLSVKQACALADADIRLARVEKVVIRHMAGAHINVWQDLFERFPAATQWEFHGCTLWDDATCARMNPGHYSHLRILHFSGTLIGWDGLHVILSHAPNLQHLVLRHNSLLSVTIIESILSSTTLCPALRTLDLDASIFVSDHTKDRWRILRPRLVLAQHDGASPS